MSAPSSTAVAALPDRPLLRITTESDWHIGSGAGVSGGTDALIQRDRDGLPVIPGSTLTGILREAAEMAAEALDEDTDATAWSELAGWLFGSSWVAPGAGGEAPSAAPRAATLSVRAARLPEPLRQALHSPALRRATTLERPGVRIDPHLGTARDNFLRWVEFARRGLVLETELAWEPLGDGHQHADTLRQARTALLVATLSLVERLGGKRRRGAGRVRIEAPGLVGDGGAWADWIAANQDAVATAVDAGLPLPPPAGSGNPVGITDAKPREQWVRVPYTLHAEGPLLTAARTAGNVVSGADHVPGGNLLGALAGHLRRAGISIDDAIAAGALVATDATVQIGDVPGRPAPLSLMRTKLDEQLTGPLWNLLDDVDDGRTQLKGLQGRWVGATPPSKTRPTMATPRRSTTTHNTVARGRQRPTADEGGLFTHRAIAAGEQLAGEILLRGDLADLLKGSLTGADGQPWTTGLLPTRVRLGRAKKGEYGDGRLSVGEPSFPTADEGRDVATEGTVTVWLLSDLLLLDDRLEPTARVEDLRSALATALGLAGDSLRLVTTDGAPRTIVQATRVGRTESWSAAWNLPRPSLVGMAAGSVVRFTTTEAIPGQRIAALEAQGLGERRAEGFGRLSIDDPLVAGPLKDRIAATAESHGDNSSPQRLLAPNADQAHLAAAQAVQRAALRDLIDRRSVELAADPDMRSRICGLSSPRSESGSLSLSQIGTIRGQLTDPDRAREALTDAEGKARVPWWLKDASGTTVTALRSLLEDPWQHLIANDSAGQVVDDLVAIEGGGIELRKELRNYAIASLATAVIHAHTRSAQHEGKEEGR